jgi:hypothetical protein
MNMISIVFRHKIKKSKYISICVDNTTKSICSSHIGTLKAQTRKIRIYAKTKKDVYIHQVQSAIAWRAHEKHEEIMSWHLLR